MRPGPISKACTEVFIASLGSCSDVDGVMPTSEERSKKRHFDISNADSVALTSPDNIKIMIGDQAGVVAAGQAGKVSIDLSGFGTVDSRSLETPELALALRRLGTVSVQASDQASVDAQGTGDASIVGDARCSSSKNDLNEITRN